MVIAKLVSIDEFLRDAPKARGPMARWTEIVQSAQWQNIMDVRRVFPTADLIVGTPYTCFNIGGNNYRLITIIAYTQQTVTVVELLAHKDYDRKY